LELDFHPDIEKLLSVKVTGITLKTSENATPISLSLPSNFITRIDSSRPYIYLPSKVCRVVLKKLKLLPDPGTNHFLISPSMHTDYMEQNPMLEFELASLKTDNDTMTINMPYLSLALNLGFPHLSPPGNKSLYFPMRCTNDSHQYVLGRAFLQEAYLIVNYERQKFTLSQVDWKKLSAKSAQVIAISSDKLEVPGYLTTNAPEDKKLSTSAISGIAVGIGIFLALVLVLLYWYRHRSIKTSKGSSHSDSIITTSAELHESLELAESTPNANLLEIGQTMTPRVELNSSHVIELDTTQVNELSNNSNISIVRLNPTVPISNWSLGERSNVSKHTRNYSEISNSLYIDTNLQNHDKSPPSPIQKIKIAYYGNRVTSHEQIDHEQIDHEQIDHGRR
jgi:hypothetical protein